MSDTSAAVTSAAVSMMLKTAWEHVLGTDEQPPFPGELTVGFPCKSKAPTAVLMVPATAVAIGVLLAVALGMEKMGGDKKARFPIGWEQYLVWKELSVACCWFLLLEHRAAVLCIDRTMTVHVLHF